MKKLLIFILTIFITISNNCIVFANEAELSLNEFKKYYEETSFYQYIPSNLEDFNNLDENEIIDYFAGIKVCKRLLDENYVLDINKVTKDDLINLVSTYALVPSDPGGGGYSSGTIPSNYDDVYVTQRKTGISSSTLGVIDYELKMYLSNDSLDEYLDGCLEKNTRDNVLELFALYIANLVVCSIFGVAAGAALDAALSLGELGSHTVNQEFYNKANNLCDSNKKAIITITGISRSVTEWTSNTYIYINATSTLYYFEAEVEYFKH